jgi:hypothetical protein
LRRLVGWVRERFGLVCCRETIRAALHRLKLSWKKAKKLLGRADPVITQGVGRRGWREAERSARAPPLRGTLEADSLASWDAPISNA